MLALFVAFAIEQLSLALVRTARPEVPSPAVRALRAIPRFTGTAVALILLSGVYLATEVGALGLAWVRVSFGAMVFIALLGGIALRSVMRSVNDQRDGRIDVMALRQRAVHPFVRASLRVRIAVALAIVYLMVAKPDFLESALLIGLALVLGAAASVLNRRSPSAVEHAAEFRG